MAGEVRDGGASNTFVIIDPASFEKEAIGCAARQFSEVLERSGFTEVKEISCGKEQCGVMIEGMNKDGVYTRFYMGKRARTFWVSWHFALAKNIIPANGFLRSAVSEANECDVSWLSFRIDRANETVVARAYATDPHGIGYLDFVAHQYEELLDTLRDSDLAEYLKLPAAIVKKIR